LIEPGLEKLVESCSGLLPVLYLCNTADENPD